MAEHSAHADLLRIAASQAPERPAELVPHLTDAFPPACTSTLTKIFLDPDSRTNDAKPTKLPSTQDRSLSRRAPS